MEDIHAGDKSNKEIMLNDDKLILRKNVDLTFYSADDVMPKGHKHVKQKKNVQLLPPYKVMREVVPTPVENVKDSNDKCSNAKKQEYITRNVLKIKDKKELKKKRYGPQLLRKKHITTKGNTTARHSQTKNATHSTRYSHKVSSYTSGDEDSDSEYHDDVSLFEDNKVKDQTKEQHIPTVRELVNKVRNEITYDTKYTVQWSGQEVLPRREPEFANIITPYVTSVRVWKIGLSGRFHKFHYAVKSFMSSTFMFWFFILYNLINNIVLAMNRYNQPKSETRITKQMNTVFTYFSFVEITLKIFSYGIIKFISDPLDFVSGSVALLNFLDMFVLRGTGDYARSFQVINTLRTFKVLKMFKMLKPIQSMKLIVRVITEAIVIFFYVTILIFIFLFVYALLGMQLFGGHFNFPDGIPRQNFDTFFHSFISVFQILNFQHWNDLLYSSMRARSNWIAIIYYISWLIIGNYILQNLFLAFMLSMFVEDNEDNSADEESLVNLMLTNIEWYNECNRDYRVS
jgi:hypothetical protein